MPTRYRDRDRDRDRDRRGRGRYRDRAHSRLYLNGPSNTTPNSFVNRR